MPYAYEFKGHGVYTPNGKSELESKDVEAYNNAIETAELDAWMKQPDRWQVYITKLADGYHHATTFLGRDLGVIREHRSFQTNISRNMVAIRFKGTNGATYYGRYGADWKQLCRVRKAR
jgi:hypothetical protein